MAQWVKNLIVAARVAAEVRVPSLAWSSGLKDLVLLQLQCRSQFGLKFNLWPRELTYAVIEFIKIKNKKIKKRVRDISQCNGEKPSFQ